MLDKTQIHLRILPWRNEEMVRFHHQGIARSAAQFAYHNVDNYNL